jgi:transcription elongation factor GreA
LLVQTAESLAAARKETAPESRKSSRRYNPDGAASKRCRTNLFNVGVNHKVGMPEAIKKKLLEEIATLERELTVDLPQEIKKAVAMGDLSENAEYHMAKQRQEFVNARLGQLKKRMGELSLVNMANIPKDKVAFGSTIDVYDNQKDEKLTYKLVTSEESDVSKGLISTTSPIGRSLMGKKVGDTAMVVTPNGNRELEILKLITIHDEVQ